MGLYDTDLTTPETEKKRIKRVIAHEPGEYVQSDVDRYITSNYPGGEDEYYNDRSSNSSDFYNTQDSLYNQVYTGQTNVQPIFEGDANRMVAGDVDDLYDDTIIEIGGGKGKEELLNALSTLGEGDEFVTFGHSSTGSNPTYGGIPLKDLKDKIPQGVNCFLGACNSEQAGQDAANALNRDVTGQLGSKEWSGSMAAPTTEGALTRPFPGVFNKTEQRTKVYNPII